MSSASFTSGGLVINGTRYAKSGNALTLTVSTSIDTKCVQLNGAHTDRQTSSTAKASWTFNLTAGSGDGLQTVTAAASPNFNASNCTGQSQSPQSASYVLDNTGPSVTAALVPAPNAAGWNNSNVAVNWSATDAGSGVATGPTPATDSQTSNTSGVTKTSTATDKLANTGNGAVTVKLDKMAPTIIPSRSPAANANGWNNADVTVSFACADGLSGIKSCPSSVVLSSSGANQSASGTALDNADNSASGGFTNINIDKVAPSLAGTPTTSPNASGWYKGNVKIAWTCSDSLSGIVGSCPADSTIASEGTGSTASASVSDLAGNTTNATSSPAVKIDKTAPVTNASAPPAWNNVDVTVDLTGSDALSGVAATYYRIDSGSQQTYSPISKPSFSAEGVYTLEYWSVDNAGNEETHHSIPVRIDKTPPTIQASKSPAANANGWNNSNVTVSFVCDDDASGIASCSASSVIASEGADRQVSGTAVDNAGNSATAYASVSLDTTDPTIEATRAPAANAAGWNNSDVTVSFTCGDALSGIDTCPGDQTLGEGANQSASGTAVDSAGNTKSAGVSGINIDETNPVLAGTATPAPNGSGWNNGDVTVSWSCSDALSGIAGVCPADDPVGGEGSNLSASAAVSDVAGNTTNTTVSGIKIDRTAPVTQVDLPTPAADDWYSGPVQVTLDASDSLSGVALTRYSIDGGAAQTYSGPFSFDQNGVHAIRFWSADEAGNVEDATVPGHEATLKIDTVNPSISADRTPAANSFGWNNSGVTVSFTCSDDDSGIRVSPPGCPAPVALASEGAGQSASGTAYDRVGNSASTSISAINIDVTAPSLSGAPTTAANAAGWYKGNVVIHWAATDPLSGVDPATVPADSTITGEGANLDASATVLDKAGNTANASVTGIKIDRSAATVDSISATVNGDTAAVTVNASDALSGVDGVTINGAAATKNADGSYSRNVPLACGVNTITAVATDKAGNASPEATKQVNRSCLWVGSILSPVASITSASATGMDAFKIKSTIPIKFKVYLDQAKSQLMTTPPSGSFAKITFAKVDNTTDGETITELLPTSTANTDGLFRWTGSPDYQYIYNLGTTGKAGGTYLVQLTLYGADNSMLAQSAKQYFVLRS